MSQKKIFKKLYFQKENHRFCQFFVSEGHRYFLACFRDWSFLLLYIKFHFLDLQCQLNIKSLPSKKMSCYLCV